MDAILLCMKKRGIRFFSKMRFINTEVQKFHERNSFLTHLRNNKQESENVMVIAHGNNDAILTTTRNPMHQYTTYISIKEASAFYNDFVFAVSCLTANEFGQKCIDSGTRAYLGYQIEIGHLFNASLSVASRVPKRIEIAVNTIVKHIFVKSLSEAYEDFLTNPVSVNSFREYFSFLLEKRISNLLDVDLDSIYSDFGIKIISRHYEKYITTIVLCVLSNLNDVLSRLICLGDGSYISPTFIKYYLKQMSVDETIDVLTNNNDFLNTLQNNKEELLAIVRGVSDDK